MNEEWRRLQETLYRPIGEWNCRHFAFPILLGISRPAYSARQLAELRAQTTEKITIGKKTKTRYEWTQVQREMETDVRYAKDLANTAKALGDDVLRREAQARITDIERDYKRISRAAGIPTRRERMQVAGFRPVKTVEQLKGSPRYATIKTESNRKQLEKGYSRAVAKGDISALTGFDHYVKVAESVERELVGIVTKDGIEITGYKTHFLDRIIGSYGQRREPVEIADAKAALLSGAGVQRSSSERASVVYRSEKCKVNVNPRSGVLVQATPRKKGG